MAFLEKLFGKAADLPVDVSALLGRARELNDDDLGICLLSPKGAVEATRRMREIPVVETLGLVILTDAGDSNPHALITRGPATGYVVYFSHDPEPEIHFTDLRSFAQALEQAKAEAIWLDEMPRQPVEPLADPAALESLTALAEQAEPELEEETEFLLCLYLPLVPLDQLPVLERLASHDSFYVREAAARHLSRESWGRPDGDPVYAGYGPAHLALAEKLARDTHPQVARPGRAALKLIRRAVGGGKE